MGTTTITSEQVEKVIVEAIERIGADPETVTREATFEVLDLDSLDLVELSQIIEDEFNVKLTQDDVAELKSVADVIDLVVARTS